MKNICVDVDATIAQYDGWKGIDHIGKPLPGAREFLQRLKELGYTIIVHSARATPLHNPGFTEEQLGEAIRRYCEENDLPVDQIWAAPGTPAAEFYVDDRAVRCRPQDDPAAFEKALKIIESGEV